VSAPAAPSSTMLRPLAIPSALLAVAAGCAVTPLPALPARRPAPERDAAPRQAGPREPAARVEAEEPEHHAPGTYVVDLFLGGVDELGDREGLAFGVDVEYVLREKVHVGVFAEEVLEADRSTVVGVQALLRPWREFVIGTGPGLERWDGDWEPVWRASLGHELGRFHDWSIGAVVAHDWNDHGNVLVWGLNFGTTF
jgi:hypothetical protein